VSVAEIKFRKFN